MANEDRSRTLFLSGLVDDNPLTSGATTLTATELADLPAIGSTEHAVIVLDPNGDSGDPEIVYVTAHTASATTATIARGQEGTTGREHDQNTRWYHGPTLREVPKIAFKSRSSGDITVNGTSWADLDTGMDLIIPGVSYAGDVVEVSMNSRWQGESVNGFLDVASLNNSDVEVNYWGNGGSESGTHEGVQGWVGENAVIAGVQGSVMKELVSGDLRTGGEVKLRFRARTSTATNKVLNASTEQVLHVWAKNHGPLYV